MEGMKSGLGQSFVKCQLLRDVQGDLATPSLPEAGSDVLGEKGQAWYITHSGRHASWRFVLVSMALIGTCAFALYASRSHKPAGNARSLQAPQAKDGVGQPYFDSNNKPAYICNAALPAIGPFGPRKFNLSSPWKEMCTNLVHPKLSWEWPGQNWCWNWMKRTCFSSYGRTTWGNVQQSVARQGLAPPPNKALMPALEAPNMCDRRELGASLQRVDLAEQQAAYGWFDATVSVYVLNMQRDTQRLYVISKRLKALGIQFSRIAGIDLTPPGAIAWAQNEGLIPSTWSHSRALEHARALSRMSEFKGVEYTLAWAGVGTVGCATAHINAIRQAENLTRASGKQIALILEDDAWLENDFVVKAYRLVRDEVPCDWQILSLSTGCPYGTCVSPHLTRIQFDGNMPKEACGIGISAGMFAMMYKVRTMGAVREKLMQTVFDESRPTCISVDTAMAAISTDCPFYAVPYLQRPGLLKPNIMGDSSRTPRNHAKLSAQDAKLDHALRVKLV